MHSWPIDGRIHVGDEQPLEARSPRAERRRRRPRSPSSAQRIAWRSPVTRRSTASPSSIQPSKAALGSISRSKPSARSISLSSSRPAAISVAMAIGVENPPVALIAGPTASGKSALALALAEQTGGVIINADSAQIYRDLPILSAAPAADELKRVPSTGCTACAMAREPCSAADWAALARREIAAVHASGQAADPGRRHRTLPADPARRHCARPADRSRGPAEGPRAARSSENRAKLARARSRGGGAAQAERHDAHRARARSRAVDRARRSASGRSSAKAGSATRSRSGRSSCCRRATGSTRAATSASRG